MPHEPQSDPAAPTLHPLGQLEALAYGWLAEPELSGVQAHVAGCPSCQEFVADAEAIRSRLALLESDEPKIDILDRVLRQIERSGSERPSPDPRSQIP